MEKLKEALNKIGWDIRGRYPNRYILDHEGKKTNYSVLDDRVEVYGASKHTTICFYFKGSKIEMVENDAVSIGTKDCFILFMNHTLEH
jgi:hypothetical protein